MSRPFRAALAISTMQVIEEGVKSRRQKTERLRVIDWEHPANNDFLLVNSTKGCSFSCPANVAALAGAAIREHVIIRANGSLLVVSILFASHNAGWQR